MLIESKFPGRCTKCGAEHAPGDMVDWVRGTKGVTCEPCTRPKPPPPSSTIKPRAKPKSHAAPPCSECGSPSFFSNEEMGLHFCRLHGFQHLQELVRPRAPKAPA